jgi:ligand-binding sensor domain-containing protein
MMIRLFVAFFITCAASAQIIQRIQRPVENMYFINDWETYSTYSRITGIVESPRIVFFGTNGAGILRYDKITNHFLVPLTRSNGLLSNNITAMYTEIADTARYYQSTVGIETDRGSQVLPLDQSDDFYLRTTDPAFFRKGRFAMPIVQITESDQFTFDMPYTYTQNGQIRGDKFDQFKITGKFTDQSYGQWLIVNNFGLFYAATSSSFYKPIKLGPISNNINAITLVNDDLYLGQSGNTSYPIFTRWAADGTWDHWRQDHVTALRSKVVHDVVSYQGKIWMGANLGLLSYDPATNEFKDYQIGGLHQAAIYEIFPFENELLLATSKGLYTYLINANDIRQYKFKAMGTVDVLSVAENERFLFAITRFGVFKVDKERNTITEFTQELDFQSIRTTLVRFQNKKFWFNNTDGVFFFDPETEETTQIVLTSSQFQLGITDIDEVDSNLFISTTKGLMIYFAKERQWVWLTKREGLPSNAVKDVIVDGDYLYIATNNGVTRFFWNDISRF